MTPNRLQTSPTREAEPLSLLLPWDDPAVLAKVSPKFGTRNRAYIGFPSPLMTLTSSQTTFDMNYENTTFEGILPPEVMEVSPPGLRWTLHNKMGGWPTFAGFLFHVSARNTDTRRFIWRMLVHGTLTLIWNGSTGGRSSQFSKFGTEPIRGHGRTGKDSAPSTWREIAFKFDAGWIPAIGKKITRFAQWRSVS